VRSQGVAVLACGGLLKGKRATIFMSPRHAEGAQGRRRAVREADLDGRGSRHRGRTASAERFAIVLRELLTTKRAEAPG
jgi:hypothetical protein